MAVKARKPTAPEAYYRRLPAINLLPEELRPRTFGRVTVLAAIMVAMELLAALAINTSREEQQARAAQLRLQVAPLKTALAQVQANLPEIQGLTAEIDRLSRSGRDLARLPRFPPLPASFLSQAFTGADARHIAMTSLTQTATGADLSGEGTAPNVVLDFLAFMQKLPMVESATLNTMSRRTFTVEKKEMVEVSKDVLRDVINQETGQVIGQEVVTVKVMEEKTTTEEMARYPFAMAVKLKR